MAWLERDVRTGNYKVGFRVGNRKVKKSVQTSSRIEAKELLAVVEQTLRAVERGWVSVPPAVDLGDFLLSGGRLAGPLQLPDKLLLSDLFQAYFASLPEGNLEPNTVSGMRQHERQLYRFLGKSFDVRLLTTADLQRYIEKRSTEPGIRGRKVTPTTIKKAIVTLRTVWNWGVATGQLSNRFPNRGLKYPKANEKPSFQTWKETEQQIAGGGLSDVEVADLWDCLVLTLPEVDQLLRHVNETARQPWVYPPCAWPRIRAFGGVRSSGRA